MLSPVLGSEVHGMDFAARCIFFARHAKEKVKYREEVSQGEPVGLKSTGSRE